MSEQIRDVYALRAAYYQKHPDGHYFDRDTLRFFGETMSTMRLLKEKARIKDALGTEHLCYVVSAMQRKHPLGPRRVYHYFDVETLEDY